MATPTHRFQIVWVVEQGQVSFVGFLVMHDGRAWVRSSAGQSDATPLASRVVAGQDHATQVTLLLGVA